MNFQWAFFDGDADDVDDHDDDWCRVCTYCNEMILDDEISRPVTSSSQLSFG